MTEEEHAAYNEALKRIGTCRHQGKQGTYLDLSNLGLTQLPPEIGLLAALQELKLFQNLFTSLPPELGQLNALTTLDVSNSRLTSLPPEIGQLNALTRLDVSTNQLTELPTEIGQLSTLSELKVPYNQLTTFPPEIGQLAMLTEFDISYNQLTSLPAEIGQIAMLTELDISGNQLTSLPPEIGQLAALTGFDARKNRLKNLLPEIGKLTALEGLDVSENQLTSLPPEINRLVRLTYIYIYRNQITSLPPEVGKMTALKLLCAFGNKLTTLPPEIGQLAALTEFDVSNNQLSSLPPEIGGLTALTVFDVSNNQLSSLPPEIDKLSALTKLYLHINPKLELPDEVLGPAYVDVSSLSATPAKPREILAYYFARLRGVNRPLNEVKVLVVGESEVGKTSLIGQLRGIDHDPKQDKTHGIERHQVTMKCNHLGDVRLNVWDFGGQDIMHATHQFFLTHRSVYLLVLDSRQNERQSRIDYWLRLIASYGGESPVIVVCNKADQQVMQLNWTGLKNEYPRIMDFAKEVCCYHHKGVDRRRGLDELRQLIAQAVAARVAQVDQPVLASWLDLKDELETDGRPYLTLRQYHQLARDKGLKEKRDREILLTLMHQLGSVLHFSEHAIFERERQANGAPAQVEELNVLDPGWVTNAIYKLLNDDDLIRGGGIMRRADLRRCLATLPGNCYPPDKEDFILAMMRRFEICFAFDSDQERWFLPDLLHKDEVPTGDWTGALGFRYEYRVLPSSIVSRLMVRLHNLLAPQCLWRTGAMFKSGECEALVRSDPEEARVDIFIRNGTPSARREFLALIRGTLASIHHSFSENLGAVELVPVPGHPGIFDGYLKLLLLEDAGNAKDFMEVKGQLIEVDVAEALNGVVPLVTRDRDRAAMAGRKKGEYGRSNRKNPSTPPIQIINKITNQNNPTMDTRTTTIHGNNYGNVGDANAQIIRDSFNTITQQPDSESKDLMLALQKDVAKLIEKLPADRQEEAAGNLELLTKAVTAAKPNRAWYSVSSDGLMEASKYVKDFTGNITGTVGQLGKLLWPDFKLPDGK